MDLEGFRNFAQGTQALLLAMAVLIGGTWAVLRLRLFQELKTARLRVEKLQHEVELRKGLGATIDFKVFTDVDGNRFITAEATIENQGLHFYEIEFEKPPFRLSRVRNPHLESYDFELVANRFVIGASLETEQAVVRYRKYGLLPLSKKSFHFCSPIESDGIYLLSFIFRAPSPMVKFSNSTEGSPSFPSIDDLPPSQIIQSGVEKFIIVENKTC